MVSLTRSSNLVRRLGLGLVAVGVTAAVSLGPSCSRGGTEVAPVTLADGGTAPPRPNNDGAQPPTPDRETDGSLDENPFPGVWKPVPGSGSLCDYLMAEDPASLKSKWLDCPSGRTGCRVLDTSWTKYPGNTVDAFRRSESVRLVGDKAYMRLRRYWPPSSPQASPYVAYVDLIEPIDGVPVLAIGSAPKWFDGKPRVCPIEAFFGDYGVAFEAWPRDRALGANAPVPETIFGWSPWGNPTSFVSKAVPRADWAKNTPGTPFTTTSIVFMPESMGADRIWLGAEYPTTSAFLDLNTQNARLMDTDVNTEMPIAVPGGAVVYDLRSPTAIMFVSDSGVPTRLVTPTSPQVVSFKALDRWSGNTLVWVESEQGAGYVNSTLWAAPLVTSEAGLSRRKVAKLDDALERGGTGVANKGTFLSLTGRNTALLTRLSDGAGWLIQGEAKHRFTSPVWVDDGDVFIETAPDPDGQADWEPAGVLRLSRSTLGDPTVPSGL